MDETKTKTKNKELKFLNCETCGDEIEALVKQFTGQTLGEFTLEKALETVHENNKKIEIAKQKIIKESIKN